MSSRESGGLGSSLQFCSSGWLGFRYQVIAYVEIAVVVVVVRNFAILIGLLPDTAK